ncbi:MAG: hypothetical protein JSR45_00395 [Proteobacteria bacterium]|nr:hypothetical protein [Pseudomonadota bacterium]
MREAVRRVAFILICAAIAVLAAKFGQPLVGKNPDAILIIITVMTVFAGFLVAIIAILGDPTGLPGGGWHRAEASREKIYSNVATHIWIFRFYLLAIALLFIGSLAEKLPNESRYELLKMWVERLYLFFGVFSFLLTLALPGMLSRLQMSRVDQEIEKRRSEAGFKG